MLCVIARTETKLWTKDCSVCTALGPVHDTIIAIIRYIQIER
jgi:hypothetical protein